MLLNNIMCKQHQTVKHTLPQGGLAITLPSGKMVAYRKQATIGRWDWVHKDFQFLPKSIKKRG